MKVIVVTIVFCASLVSAIFPPQCGEPNRLAGSGLHPHILGGELAFPHEFPWMAHLKIGHTQKMCGASIISDRWLLTAAHCTVSNNILAFLGRHNISNPHENGSRTLSVQRIVHHPMYNSSNDSMQHDFALLYLNESLTFSNTMRPICLPAADMCRTSRSSYSTDVDSFFSGVVAGWGLTERGAAEVLLKLHRSFISNSQCQSTLSILFNVPNHPIGDSKFCTLPTRGASTCMGDSGGPMMGRRGQRYFIIGLVSYGDALCSQHYESPSVYARVCSALDWIRNETSSVSTQQHLQRLCTRRFRTWFVDAQLGRLGQIRRKLDRGQCIDAKDKDGMTALAWAAKSNKIGVVQHLINNGTAVDLKDSFGLTPLMQAALNGHKEAVEILLKAGADVNIRAGAGTPLTLAATLDYVDVVAVLLQNGANVNDVDGNGQTAYDATASQRVRALLQSHGGGPAQHSVRLSPED